MWIRLAVIILLELLIMPKAAALIAAVMALLILAILLRSSANMKKSVTGQKWTIWIEDGKVKADRGVGGEMPCSRIELIRTTPHLLMFGYMQTAVQQAWYIIPLRAFADTQEQELFLNTLRNPQPAENAYIMNDYADKKPEDTAAPEYLRFTYTLNEEKWVHFQKEASGVIVSGTIGKTGRVRAILLFTCFMTAVLMMAVYFAAGHLNWRLAVYSVAIAVLLTVRLFFRNPERGLRIQVKTPAVRDRVCGVWQISVRDEGIDMEMPMGIKNFYPWELLEWLVETENAFYLFHKDKKHYVIIAKESFQDWNQVSMLHQICAQKGIKAVQGKKMRYMPDWLFILLVGMFAIACVAVFAVSLFLNIQGNKYMKVEQPYTKQNFSDYPVRVPLDKQVEVLNELGFEVPSESVERIRAYMTEYGMAELIEDNPYTWLLTELGRPEYDDDWNISGYSKEVFWFDLEGRDISTDYIEVLNGMLALAEGSSLDSVSDIREDTAKVNWEDGTGTITVSLAWNGAVYSCDMDMEYDWIDRQALGILNELLVPKRPEKLFYTAWDNGQGAIVFFCTKRWAEEFTDKTGLELQSYATRDGLQKSRIG